MPTPQTRSPFDRLGQPAAGRPAMLSVVIHVYTEANNLDRLHERLRAAMVPAATLEAVLKQAGAPIKPVDLGWPRAFYLDAVCHAREIRNRYTFLE